MVETLLHKESSNSTNIYYVYCVSSTEIDYWFGGTYSLTENSDLYVLKLRL